jgi:O-antigen/teichoic acid export membrane protein
LLAFIFVIIFILCGKFHEAIFTLIIYVIAVKDFFLKISNSAEDYKKFALANAFLAFGKIIFLLILLIRNDNILIILSVFLVSELFFLLPFVWRRSRQKSISLKRRASALVLMLSYGGPLVVASIAVWLISLSDRYILSFFLNTHEVANYIIIYQFSANAITIPVIFFITVYYPKLIRIDRELGLAAALEYNTKMLKKYFIIAPIFGVFISAVIWIAIKYLYKAYVADLFVIIIIICAQILCGAGHFYNKKYELNNKTHYIATAVLISAVVSVGSNFLLVPKMGLMGAALSSFAAYLFLLLFTMNADRIIPLEKGKV